MHGRKPHKRDRDLDPAKGILIGIVFSAAFWTLIVLAVQRIVG